MPELKALEQLLRITFKNKQLLETALIHRSYINENRGIVEHNERLEFLGDAVLELVVTEFLYKNYQNPEGELTNWRSALVKGEHLAGIATNLRLGEFLQLSKGEERSGGRKKNYILANTLEAIIGAIYLDKDYATSKKFIEKNILSNLEEILAKKLHIDAKSQFQEIAQEREEVTPEYHMLKQEGPDHNKIFTMGVYLNEKLIARGKGSSKQNAEQEAARKALKKLDWE